MDQPAVAEIVRRIEELTAEVRALRERVPPLLVSVKDAAKRLDVSTRTVERWVRDRRIPFVKLGKIMRIDLTNVRALSSGELELRVREARNLSS